MAAAAPGVRRSRRLRRREQSCCCAYRAAGAISPALTLRPRRRGRKRRKYMCAKGGKRGGVGVGGWRWLGCGCTFAAAGRTRTAPAHRCRRTQQRKLQPRALLHIGSSARGAGAAAAPVLRLCDGGKFGGGGRVFDMCHLNRQSGYTSSCSDVQAPLRARKHAGRVPSAATPSFSHPLLPPSAWTSLLRGLPVTVVIVVIVVTQRVRLCRSGSSRAAPCCPHPSAAAASGPAAHATSPLIIYPAALSPRHYQAW